MIERDRLPILASGLVVACILVVTIAFVSDALQSVHIDHPVTSELRRFSRYHSLPTVPDVDTLLSQTLAAAIRAGFVLGILGGCVAAVGGLKAFGRRNRSDGQHY